MNKNDMLKAAKRLDDMGVDPDLVMLQSVEEYSESYDDEVDTYDEDKKDIRDTEIKVEELSYEIADLENQVLELTSKIEECSRTITRMQTEASTTRNWAMKMEYEEFIKEEEKEQASCTNQRTLLVQKRDLLVAKRDKLVAKLVEMRAAFDNNYGSRNF